VGAALHRGDLAHRLTRDAGDLGGEPVDLAHGDAGTPAEGLGELAHPAPGRAAGIPEPGARGHAAGIEAPHQPTVVRTACSSRSASVGWSMSASTTVVSILSLRLRSTRSAASLPSSAVLSWPITSEPGAKLAEGGGVGDGLVQRDAAEPAPRDRVANLAAEGLIAQAVPVLEVQQAQQGRDRHRGPPEPRGEVGAPRGGEALVVEVGVDAGEFVGQAGGLVGQQVVPGGQRWGGRTNQQELQTTATIVSFSQNRSTAR
jgi:hypothetical protein